MPICKKCSVSFPNRVVIDGKIRQLCKRKYCLMCSPFGEHNTKKIDLTVDCKCIVCGREYIYNHSQGHTLKRCNSCSANRKRNETKLKAIQYKGGKCQICGYNKCITALTFHHVDPSTKEFNISGNHGLRWDRIRKELDKCVLLCHNCHAEIHQGGVLDGFEGWPYKPVHKVQFLDRPLTQLFMKGESQ